ncbi:MAG: HAMP domain-containing histidine kinase [Deltaproteobacteria bacterium]|nr:HAMP domain-containing histidine kinase [Deltaproteobacteria bacterium]
MTGGEEIGRSPVERLRVLWVDDEPRSLGTTTTALCEIMPELLCDFASSISVALNKLAKEVYGVLLVDIYDIPLGNLGRYEAALAPLLGKFQNRTGLALVEAIRTGLLPKSIGDSLERSPIIVTSGFPHKALLQDGLDVALGNVFFLPKADIIGNPAALAAAIKDALSAVADSGSSGEKTDGSAQHTMQASPHDLSGVRRITRTFAQMLHDNILELIAARDAVENINHFFGPNPFNFSPDETGRTSTALFDTPASAMIDLVSRVHRALSTPSDAALHLIPLRTKSAAAVELAGEVRGFQDSILPSNLLELADEALQLVGASGIRRSVDGGLLGQLETTAIEVKRISCQFDLNQLSLRLEEMLQRAELVTAYLRSGDAKLTDEKRRISTTELLASVVASAQSYARAKGVEIQLKRSSADFVLRGDFTELARALKSILLNGVKYSFGMQGGRLPWVVVSQNMEANQVCISIENWGVPIVQEELDSGLIFQEGYRSEDAKRHSKSGHGMGLSDALAIIKRHSGSITAESVPAQSRGGRPSKAHITTFRVRLPYQRAERAKDIG